MPPLGATITHRGRPSYASIIRSPSAGVIRYGPTRLAIVARRHARPSPPHRRQYTSVGLQRRVAISRCCGLWLSLCCTAVAAGPRSSPRPRLQGGSRSETSGRREAFSGGGDELVAYSPGSERTLEDSRALGGSGSARARSHGRYCKLVRSYDQGIRERRGPVRG